MHDEERKKMPVPVVAITAIDALSLFNNNISSSSKILVVIRDPNTNINHPNVISTPTQRIPLALYNSILEQYNGNKDLVSNVDLNTHDPIIYVVESLFSKKLGVANALEKRKVTYTAKIGAVKFGRVYHKQNTESIPVLQYISMINILVFIHAGITCFPSSTSSYSKVMWKEVGKFLTMVENRNPMDLSLDLNPFEYCVHGICLASSAKTLRKQMKNSKRIGE